MIAPGTISKRSAIVTRAMERRGQAFVHWLADTCREWPEIRQWLCEDFVREKTLREQFRKLVEADIQPQPQAVSLADLAAEGSAWLREKAQLQRSNGVDAPRIYGGRTWQEMEQLVCRYEGGMTELGVFFLARHWRRMGLRAKFAPELQRAGAEFLDEVICGGQLRLLGNMSRALRLLKQRNRANFRTVIGYADWWKLQTCFYILRNPRSAYQTRDLRSHLAGLGLTISSLDVRRFCRRHGIRRDMRAGRPRTRARY